MDLNFASGGIVGGNVGWAGYFFCAGFDSRCEIMKYGRILIDDHFDLIVEFEFSIWCFLKTSILKKCSKIFLN